MQYDAYDGDAVIDEELAILHVPTEIKVDRIDGEGRYYPLLEILGNPYRGATIRLLPGSHTADVIFHARYWHTSDTQTIAFNVRAGGQYDIRASIREVDYLKQVEFEIVERKH